MSLIEADPVEPIVWTGRSHSSDEQYNELVTHGAGRPDPTVHPAGTQGKSSHFISKVPCWAEILAQKIQHREIAHLGINLL